MRTHTSAVTVPIEVLNDQVGPQVPATICCASSVVTSHTIPFPEGEPMAPLPGQVAAEPSPKISPQPVDVPIFVVVELAVPPVAFENLAAVVSVVDAVVRP